MKFKTTKKDIKENYFRIIGIGNGQAQNLLKYENPVAYSERSEGWACDYYDIDATIISTGYEPLSSRQAKASHDVIRYYDNIARKIVDDNRALDISYDKTKNELRTLIREFIGAVKT